jgi:hypothetical protein
MQGGGGGKGTPEKRKIDYILYFGVVEIENSIKKALSTQKVEQPNETDRWFDLNELCQYHEVLLQFVIIFLRQVRKK